MLQVLRRSTPLLRRIEHSPSLNKVISCSPLHYPVQSKITRTSHSRIMGKETMATHARDPNEASSEEDEDDKWRVCCQIDWDEQVEKYGETETEEPPEWTPSNPPKKTLVLDIDETLSCDQTSNAKKADFTLKSHIGTTYYVTKRPHLDLFLEKVAKWYDVLIYASMMSWEAEFFVSKVDPKREIIKGIYSYRHIPGRKCLNFIRCDPKNTVVVGVNPDEYCTDNVVRLDQYNKELFNSDAYKHDDALLRILPTLYLISKHEGDVQEMLSTLTPLLEVDRKPFVDPNV